MLSLLFGKLSARQITLSLGIELEFYSTKPASFFNFPNIKIKKEIGKNQLEAVISHEIPAPDALKTAINFRVHFKNDASFKAYYPTLPPCALQFNISLNQNGNNILTNSIITAVLHSIPQNLPFFAPTSNCIKRLTDINKIQEFRNSPFTISLGAENNRTSAIRVKENYFEHRVPSGSCKILKSFIGILTAIVKELENPQNTTSQILYCNCFEEEVIKQFNLQKIIN